MNDREVFEAAHRLANRLGYFVVGLWVAVVLVIDLWLPMSEFQQSIAIFVQFWLSIAAMIWVPDQLFYISCDLVRRKYR